MTCPLCEGRQVKVSLLEEQIKDLNQRIKELERINDTLVINLKNSQQNQNWKFQYEALVAQNHTLISQINTIKKFSWFKDLTKPVTPISKQKLEAFINQSTSNGFSLYQTPRSQARTQSSEKMSTFMSTMKKNQIRKTGLFIKSISNEQTSKNHYYDRCISPLFKSRNQRKYQDEKEKLKLRKSCNPSKQKEGKHNKIVQIFGSFHDRRQRKGTRRTLIELLVEG